MSRLNLRSLFIKPTQITNKQIPLQLLPTNHLPTDLTLLRCCSGKMFLLGLCEKSIFFVIFFFFFVNTNANTSSLTKRRPAMINYVAVFKLMFSIMLTCDVSNDKQLFCTECPTFTFFLCSCFYVQLFLVDLGLQKKPQKKPDPTVVDDSSWMWKWSACMMCFQVKVWLIQTQHVEYEIYFVMFYMILTLKYKEPTLCTLPQCPVTLKCRGCVLVTWHRLSIIRFHIKETTKCLTHSAVPPFRYQCVVKKQTCETCASVIAGKLQTSSVLTTNKNKSHKTKLSGYIF